MRGLPILLGLEPAILFALVQGSGSAWRMDAVDLSRQMERTPAFKSRARKLQMLWIGPSCAGAVIMRTYRRMAEEAR